MSRRYEQRGRSPRNDRYQSRDDRDNRRKDRDPRGGNDRYERNDNRDRGREQRFNMDKVEKTDRKRRFDEDYNKIKRRNQEQSSDEQNERRKSRQRSRRQEYRQNRRRARRKYRFDSPPRSDDQKNQQDPQEMAKLTRMKAEQQLVTTKADRKLYLGNLPPNITTNQLMQLLNSALKKMNINTDVEGDSIVSAWISPDGVGHYAFIEFRTKQQASNGMDLNNASLFGYQLKLGRPKQYLQYTKQLMTDMNGDGDLDWILKKVATMGAQEQFPITDKIIYPPSRILILKHIVSLEQLAIDEEYDEIMQDVKDMASRFGKVLSITIPRPVIIQSNSIQLAPRVKGLGYVFVEYENSEVAKSARKQFLSKMFSERSVACSFFDESQYKDKNLDIIDKVIITF